MTPPIKPSEDATPDQRIQAFQNIASRPAFELAQLLAAAPLFLPVMRLVQKVMLPASGQVHLAEFFSSELIRHDPIVSDTVDPEQMQYEFMPGVREALLKPKSTAFNSQRSGRCFEVYRRAVRAVTGLPSLSSRPVAAACCWRC
jgi:hypothetical protein